jgi:hypothetical protein
MSSTPIPVAPVALKTIRHTDNDNTLKTKGQQSTSYHKTYAEHSTPTYETSQAQATTYKKQHADDSYAHAHTLYASHA